MAGVLHNGYFKAAEQQAAGNRDGTSFRFVSAAGAVASSHGEFYADIQAAAAFLAARGLGPGQVVLIFAQHGATMLHAFFGAQLISAIPAFMPPPTSRQDPASWLASHRALCDRIRPALLLADPACLDAVLAIGADRTIGLDEIAATGRPDPAAFLTHAAGLDEIALLQHSSGTTGLKKGVMITYRQLQEQIASYSDALGLAAGHSVVSWLPVYHDMGLIAATLLPFCRGLPVHWIDTFAWLARPELFIEGLAGNPGAVAWMPNFAFTYLALRCRQPLAADALAGVKAIINCSEPCKPKDMGAFVRRFAAAGLRPEAAQVCYAMAENVFAVTQTRLDARPRTIQVDTPTLLNERRARDPDPEAGSPTTTLVSCGFPVARTTIRLAGAGEDRVIGEIEVAGSSLCGGYYRGPDLTESKFVDGWYRTGDFGFMDGGELFVTGRKDDLIIVRGRNIYAHDVEAIVTATGQTQPGRCVAIGVPDEASGTQQLVVLAERSAATSTFSVGLIVEAIFAEFGVSPSDVVLVDRDVLVKTTSGKISRADNLTRYGSGLLQSWSV